MLLLPGRVQRPEGRRFPRAGRPHDQVDHTPGGSDLFYGQELVGTEHVRLAGQWLLAGSGDCAVADLRPRGVPAGVEQGR